MSKISTNKKWHVLVPLADKGWGGGGIMTNYRIAKTINAPTYNRAIEEAEPIAKKHVDKYLEDTGKDASTYQLRGKTLWRVQEEKVYKGTKMERYI